MKHEDDDGDGIVTGDTAEVSVAPNAAAFDVIPSKEEMEAEFRDDDKGIYYMYEQIDVLGMYYGVAWVMCAHWRSRGGFLSVLLHTHLTNTHLHFHVRDPAFAHASKDLEAGVCHKRDVENSSIDVIAFFTW